MNFKSYRCFLCLISALAILLVFSGCKKKDIYAESSDFESFPDYYNSFQEDLSSKNDSKVSSSQEGTSGEISSPDIELEDGETDIIVDNSSQESSSESSSSEDESSSEESSSTDSSSSEESSSSEASSGIDLGNMGPLIPLH